ncbi:MAG: hypothetical protein ILA34_07380 [Bacteroidaceae bacterium]|nr:hypothetical protein [Bacteroidaceae bacterium]
MMTNKKNTQTGAPSAPRRGRRDVGTWLVRNALLLVVAGFLLSKVTRLNMSYSWLWNNYLKGNVEMIRQYPNLTYDEKMGMKLGADYQYLLWLRDNTPQDAVVYYPSAGDFRAGHPAVQQNPFNGKLNDKLTAVRVLYPRRVVTEDEWGKTSWTAKVTHVGVVNGRNKDKVPYPVPDNFVIGALPMQQPVQPAKTQEP